MTKAETKPKDAASEFRETVVVIIEALLIAVVFRTFLWQPFVIPSGSLQPTMLIGDYFLANKWTWGFSKYSFIIPLPINDRLLATSQPQTGDIAVFHNEPTGDDYVKRVIGLPGDTIQMKEGRLYINGTEVPREQVGTGTDTDSYETAVPVIIYKETLPNGVVHTIQEIDDNQPLDNTAEYVVPAGHYFMMGDNRDLSADSRVLTQVGYVPAYELIGKGEARFLSIDGNIPLWQVWSWPLHLRLDRMFQSIYR